MKKEEYALLMLDNMQLNGYFVISKEIGHLDSDNLEEQLDYTIYEDLLTKNIIYPASYEVNEFIDSLEYEKQLSELKWISRKKISKEIIFDLLKKMDKSDIESYSINVFTSKEKKKKNYKEELDKHKKIMKELGYKK